MANLPQQFNINARNWTTESGSFVPPQYHVFWYYNHPSYSGIVYVIGNGSTVFSSLSVYISPWQGPFAGPLVVSSGGAEITGGVSINSGAVNTVLELESTDIYASLVMKDPTTVNGDALIRTGDNLALVPNGGNVAIGVLGLVGSEKLRVNGKLLISSGGAEINSSAAVGLTVDRATATATDKIASFVSNVGGTDTENAYIEADGDLYNTNGTYGTISDLKLKENITDATEKLADLLGVRIVNYELKREPGKKLLGVIAQELEEIMPGLIKEVDDFELLPDMDYELKPERVEKIPVMETIEEEKTVILEENGKYIQKKVTESKEVQKTETVDLYNEAGEIIGQHDVPIYTEEIIPAETEVDRPLKLQKNGEKTKTVKMSVFIPMLIKSIQELDAKIEALS